MKNGYMFFLNLGTVTYMARILLIGAVFAFFSVEGFYQKLIVSACLFVLFVISVIKAPSDKDVVRAIEFFRTRFKEKIGDTGHTFSMNGVRVLEAYRVKGKMRMRRTVGYDIIYPNLISVALAHEDKGKLMLYVDELCLLRRGGAAFHRCVVDNKTLRISTRLDDVDKDVVWITLGCPLFEKDIEIIAKNDFHYREFVEAAESLSTHGKK